MGYSVIVDSSNFEQEVIENSHKNLVLIDFFATWCGPCKLLKPILEKLLEEYDFILATIDIDLHPDLAQKFGVEGVPDVKIAFEGEIMQGFVGVLPEADIRDLLAQFNLKSDLDSKLEEMHQAMANKDVPKAKILLDELFAKYPNHPQLILEASKFLIRLNRLEDASKMLKTIGVIQKEYYAKAQGMQTLIELKKSLENPGETELDQLFAQAARLTLIDEYEAALKLFLQIVESNRKYREDGARKAMLGIFNILGSDHPLTKEYQQALILVLY
ncbi:tetratricopeptide repeat protein [Crocosphaera sp. XPORK-15E]|uniref:tetratricopeptide repeat protein n=1 Tax=Crocosphaera sp. XPORK-15E TaxID=3110247 RepID=UPI002B1F5FDC|nr:tetratricopeptide repeat protein [Crocosphaera sp. XPORK-15E]MEA5536746.1 tetratricopeptide repeat protein [Crocosphaera sp. XPORK-15E]